MARHIGIDLGTTYSAMAYVVDDDAEIIENANGDMTTPSVVMIDGDEVTVGRAAKNQAISQPDKVATRVKDLMGSDETVLVDGEEKRPEEISAYILEKLVADAEDKIGDEVEAAVITVPYYFDEPAREATRDAADIAGLNVKKLMNEPTAACYAFGLRESDFEGLALIFDLGGGTFDATLVDIQEDHIDVMGTGGSKDLGGENFDDELYEYVRQEMIDAGFPDPEDDKQMRAQVRQAVVVAKEDLSDMSSTNINLFLGEMFDHEISREKFEEVTSDLVKRTINDIDDLFDQENVNVGPNDVDEVILVGGSTRIPIVQQRVTDYFGFEPSMTVSPDRAVAIGAAIEAATYEGVALPGQTQTIYDVLSHTLGVATLPANADPAGDPDLRFDPILEKNKHVPASDQKIYTTATDDQRTVEIKILQGEAELAKDSKTIGTFELEGIDPRPAGEPQLEVTFSVDEEGLLTAEVEDLDMGDNANVTLDDTLGLTEQEKKEIEQTKGKIAPRQ